MRYIIPCIMALTMIVLLPSGIAHAYGGNGGDKGTAAEAAPSSFEKGTVGWSSNPAGIDAVGPADWHGQPGHVTGGTDRSGRAAGNAEQGLLAGFKDDKGGIRGEQGLKVELSGEAHISLDTLKDRQKTSTGNAGGTFQPMEERIEKGLSMLEACNTPEEQMNRIGKTQLHMEILTTLYKLQHDLGMSAIKNIKP